jgi:hypothetical protein
MFLFLLVLNVDIMDETGEHSSGYSQDVTKVRLSLSGVPLETGETISKIIATYNTNTKLTI